MNKIKIGEEIYYLPEEERLEIVGALTKYCKEIGKVDEDGTHRITQKLVIPSIETVQIILDKIIWAVNIHLAKEIIRTLSKHKK